MPLIDLKTNLKDLKYGHDQRGGGSSGQPYITTPIPEGDYNSISFDDGLIRGGAIGAIKHSANDFSRIFKFLKDAPRGPLFLAKQVGLQLSNPRIETNKGLFGNNNLGPTRLYNLGINTLAQVPVGAFGIHFQRHGLLPFTSDNDKYEYVVSHAQPEENRLVKLRDKLILRNEELKLNKKDNKQLGRLLGEFGVYSSNVTNFLKAKRTKQESIIEQYIGGPGSVDGIGTTTIRRTSYTPAINEESTRYWDEIRNQNRENLFQTNTLLQLNSDLDANLTGSVRRTFDTFNLAEANIDRFGNIIPFNTNEEIDNIIISQTNYNIEQKILRADRKKFFIDDRINRGNPGLKKDRSDYSKGEALDKITALPIFKIKKEDDLTSAGKAIRDLVKFRFEAIDNDNPSMSNVIVFRSFIKGISFPINPEWTGIKYNGRGEQFYVNTGFTNNISFNFQLAAQSRAEMKPMYQKLNYLYSNCTPDYKGTFMRGPLMRLTIGNLIYRQHGFISSLTPTVNDDAPWEIALDEPDNNGNRKDTDMLELPHMIDVSCTFTPIYNFLPKKSLTLSPFIADKGNEVASGERWIPNTELRDVKNLNDQSQEDLFYQSLNKD